MKKYFCLVLCLAIVAGFAACNGDKASVDETVVVTETSIVNVTDASGETVTDAFGEPETEVVTVPVTETVTNVDGETVTNHDTGEPETQVVTSVVATAASEKGEGKSTTNWRDRFNTTTSAKATTAVNGTTASGNTTTAESTSSVNLGNINGGGSTYYPGDYTKNLKALINTQKYSMEVTLNANLLEQEMKNTNVSIYVDGNKKAYKFKADLSGLDVSSDDFSEAETSGFDVSALFGNLKNFQMDLILKDGKSYMVLPQLLMYMEVPSDEFDLTMGDNDEFVSVILSDGEYVSNKTEGNYTVETFKTDSGVLIHYYYQRGVFKKIVTEENGVSQEIISVQSLRNTVKASDFEISKLYKKIDASTLG